MNRLSILISCILAASLICASCKKEGYNETSGGTALTIVNAVVGSPGLITNFNAPSGNKQADTLQYYRYALQIGYGGFAELSGSGVTNLSLTPADDTLVTLWSGSLNLLPNAIYSFFLSGPDTAHVDTMLVTDHPLPHDTPDSSVGIRFINLSPGSNPVSINIQGNPNGSEIPSLAYKGVTNFKNYPATSAVSTYIFEFRDAATGTLLTTYEMDGVNYGTNGDTNPNSLRWHNVTIALEDLPGQQFTVLINDY